MLFADVSVGFLCGHAVCAWNKIEKVEYEAILHFYLTVQDLHSN